MMFFSKTIARIINARQTAEQRQQMRRHAGMVVALRVGGARLCWRLSDGGRWRAAAGCLSADAEARWAAGESLQISGDSALLQDVDEVWRHNAPHKLFADAVGEESSAAIMTAFQSAVRCGKSLPRTCGVAADADAVKHFNQTTAALDAHSRRLAARLSRLEKNHA